MAINTIPLVSVRKSCGYLVPLRYNEETRSVINENAMLNTMNSLITAYVSTLPSKGDENMEKNLDVFISYRRSNGSQLASLLKVHLELRGFTVFIDVERLEAGKFDNNLLQSIRQARHFLLVLTPNALDRCKGDNEQKDWVHRVSNLFNFF